MGAKIEMVKRQDNFENRLKLVEGALEEVIKKVDELLKNNTRVHHVDLHEETAEETADYLAKR